MTNIRAQEMLKWLNQNIQTLRQNYCNQYIAYNAKGVLAHDQDLDHVTLFRTKRFCRGNPLWLPFKSEIKTLFRQ